MSGLEIAGFIIGLGGLAAIFDTTCVIWKTISQASEFGEDVANSMSKIQMEYFRFQMWWTALHNLAADSRPIPAEPILGPTQLVDSLRSQMANPLISTAAHVLTLLKELEQILAKNQALPSVTARTSVASATSQSAGHADDSVLQEQVELRRYLDRQKALAKELLRSVSWWKRLKHGAAPWKENDKQQMTRIHADLIYWNNSLYGILPHDVRQSILQQGIAGYILDTEDNSLELSQTSQNGASQRAAAIEYAQIHELRVRTRHEAGKSAPESLRKIVSDMGKSPAEIQGLPETYDKKHPFSILVANEPAKLLPMESKVLIEWYQYPPPKAGLDTWILSEERIARLSYLLREQSRPATLHTLNSLGYVDNKTGKCFGLILEIPDWASNTHEPVTLHDLLSRLVYGLPCRALPSLQTKYELAATLASTLYTFMLTRWHHKRFHSSSIFFLRRWEADPKYAFPDLTKPYIGGFAVSRPDAPNEDTFPGMTASETELYLHPTLRGDGPSATPPRFDTSFEIYSFGILLAEIGFWNVLPKIALAGLKDKNVQPTKLRQLLINKCTSDLGCWMGERYQHVALKCLTAGIPQEEGGIRSNQNDFYWQVVLELIKCASGV